MEKDVLGTEVRPTDFSVAFTRHGRHFARYLFAAKLAPGKHVLDIACGGGFGSAYLAIYGQARSVTGMDLDDEMLEHARAAFHAGNLEFRKHDLHEPIKDAGPFDLITTFETLEHVRDPQGCVRTISAALAEGGTALISVPNGSKEVRDQADKPYHQRHFSATEFERLLREHFAEVDLRSQIYQKSAAHYLRKLTLRNAHHAESYRFIPGLNDIAKTWLAICKKPVNPSLRVDAEVS